jgi:hypothetical protein
MISGILTKYSLLGLSKKSFQVFCVLCYFRYTIKIYRVIYDFKKPVLVHCVIPSILSKYTGLFRITKPVLVINLYYS